MLIRYIGFNWTKSTSGGRLQYLSSTDHVLWALAKNGHSIDRTPVTPEEDLSMYDRIVVNLSPPGSMMARAIHGCLYALSRYWDKCRVTVDDWQTKGIQKGFDNPSNDKRNFGENKMTARLDREWADDNRPELEAIMSRLHRELPKLAVPCNRRGNLTKLCLSGAEDYFAFDPTQQQLEEYLPKFQEFEKKHVWVYAGLHDHLDWVIDTIGNWPYLIYGPRALGAPRLTEPELFVEYCKVWGVLSPKYSHSGSGWYRARHLLAAAARAIVVGDDAESKLLYDNHCPTAREVEALSDRDRDWVRNCQFASLVKNTLTPEQSSNVINSWIA